jgi:hypothetical protein
MEEGIKHEVENLDSTSKKQLDKTIFKSSNALTDKDLQQFCSKFKIPYKEITLEQLVTGKVTPNQAFIFTGEKQDEYNKGTDHHWIYLYFQHLFDSANFHRYNLGNLQVDYVTTTPKQLQEFGSVVCGQYALAFAEFANKYGGDEEDLGQDFSEEFGFTSSKKENDEIVRKWYDDKMSS